VTQAQILLDTCAALWMAEDSLSKQANDALTRTYESGLATLVSPITAWEVGLLAARNRFKSTMAPHLWFQRLMALPNLRLADMPPEVLLGSSFMPGEPPRDPAVRVIVATAREFGLTVMTRDRAILDYAKEGHVHAFEC
jgi:PIN domain nuclease of toxin-antitoxin system